MEQSAKARARRRNDLLYFVQVYILSVMYGYGMNSLNVSIESIISCTRQRSAACGDHELVDVSAIVKAAKVDVLAILATNVCSIYVILVCIACWT